MSANHMLHRIIIDIQGDDVKLVIGDRTYTFPHEEAFRLAQGIAQKALQCKSQQRNAVQTFQERDLPGLEKVRGGGLKLVPEKKGN